MRISTNQIFTGNVNNLSRANAELFKTQQQISTGKKILQPSDDPLASAQIIKLKQELARTEQFQSNIEVTDRRLGLQEIALGQIFNDTVRLKELTIQAGSPALTDNDRQALVAEVREIVNQLQGQMNSRDTQGEYLFSGFKGNTQAYRYDQATERYIFQGDSGQRSIQVGPNNIITATDSAVQVFESVQPVNVPVLDNADGLVSNLYVKNFAEFEQSTEGVAFNISLNDAGLLTITSTPAGQPVFSDDQPPIDLTNVGINVEAGDTVKFAGVRFDVQSLPAAGNTFSADLSSRPERSNILNTALKLEQGLSQISTGTEAGKAALGELLARTLKEIEATSELNLRARGSIGARMNALESQQRVNEDFELFTRTALSSFEDLDYNEAISRFTLQQTVLEAAYSSFNRISNLSLFNFIQ